MCNEKCIQVWKVIVKLNILKIHTVIKENVHVQLQIKSYVKEIVISIKIMMMQKIVKDM